MRTVLLACLLLIVFPARGPTAGEQPTVTYDQVTYTGPPELVVATRNLIDARATRGTVADALLRLEVVAKPEAAVPELISFDRERGPSSLARHALAAIGSEVAAAYLVDLADTDRSAVFDHLLRRLGTPAAEACLERRRDGAAAPAAPR